ncbi:MAG: GNAT family N-acetyltransferase [Actinobacteria bacterium HGW-Actinobacteria-10]|jgi:phosphinothricin acetyltransferase|nr:MAG: GNAT family N-acetyltransferase [Actinobacteria bacterium HGW-Actinobacteria-10]
MPDILVRDARDEDAATIAEIYNYYVLNTVVTFDTEPKTTHDRVEWIREHGPLHPIIVAEQDGHLMGWASLSPFSNRPAWSLTVELGLYLSPDARQRGIGTLLMKSIIDRARSVGHHVVIGQIVSDNEPSLRLGQRAGFREVGRLLEVGNKFDRQLDVVIQELIL